MTSQAALELIGVTKEKFIAAGLNLLEEIGLDRFRIEKVAELCRVRSASIYKYFKSSDEFQDALTAGALALLVDVHRDASSNQMGRDALEAFAQLERAYALAHPTLYAVALRAPRGPSAELRLLRQIYMGAATKMLRGYDIPQAVAPEIANCLSAALQGFVNAEITGRGGAGLEFDRNYDRLLDMLDAGARAARRSQGRQPLELVAHR